MLGRVTLRRI